jgi:hypothetical protein
MASKYPAAVKEESGCKVGWRYYRSRALADKAAAVARKEANRLAGLGYDFGFQMPGEVNEVSGGPNKGLFSVVVP